MSTATVEGATLEANQSQATVTPELPERTEDSQENTQHGDNDNSSSSKLQINPASSEVHQSLQSLVDTFHQVLGESSQKIPIQPQHFDKHSKKPSNQNQNQNANDSVNAGETSLEPASVSQTQASQVNVGAEGNNDADSSEQPKTNETSVDTIASALAECTIAAAEAETSATTTSGPPDLVKQTGSCPEESKFTLTTDANTIRSQQEQQKETEKVPTKDGQSQNQNPDESETAAAKNTSTTEEAPARQITTSASGTEIQEESLKNALKEIISEIDQAVSSETYNDKGTATATTVTASLPQTEQSIPPQICDSIKSAVITEAEIQSRPAAPFAYILPSQTTPFQPWCPSSDLNTSSIQEQSYETYDLRTTNKWDNSSSFTTTSSSSPLPYFLTRPSRLTPVPFTSGYSDHSNLDDPKYFPSGSASIESKNCESAVSWNHTKDRASMSDEKGMNVSGRDRPRIDLEKLFTPAPDSDSNYLPTRRKIYGSSSFYSETHPTVEEQVDLARKISQSLTDASNQKSKGQSMYVKRKKKSVKWIHEGPEGTFTGGEEESSVEQSDPTTDYSQKPLLKLVMNPSGHVMDWQSLKASGVYNDHGALSPEMCQNLMKDMHSPTGKGAQLFAKRRKKAENWIVDETNVKRSGTLPSLSSNLTSPANKSFYTLPRKAQFMPDPSFIDKTRVQHAQKLNEIQERFSQPKLRIIKSPWEAALETGSVETAFEEIAHSPAVNSLVAAAERKLTQPPPFSAPAWQSPAIQPYQPPDTTWETQNYSSSYPGDLELPSLPSYAQPQPSIKRISMLDFGTNYNTAPRGFSYGQTIYRPVILN